MDAPQRTIEALLQRIATLEQTIATLQEENRLLREQLEHQQRTSARQAAPFRRRDGQKVAEAEKKRPGRKPGHQGAHRAVPDHVDQAIEEPLSGCPHCGGPVSECRPVEQFIEEIPPVCPRVVRLVTWEGHCAKCGEVHSTHPLQTSRGRGAANKRAERSLRPAVIARKISCGNKTDRGRRTWQIFASLAATCVQRGNDLIDYLTACLPLTAHNNTG